MNKMKKKPEENEDFTVSNRITYISIHILYVYSKDDRRECECVCVFSLQYIQNVINIFPRFLS